MSADNQELDMRPRLAVDGPCPACNNGKFHTEGCPVIPRDRELLHLRAEVRQKVEVIHDFLAVQPREWTAETIAGAPEGEYRIGELVNGNWSWDRWREKMKSSCLILLKGIPGSEAYLNFFGPIPQPPINGDHDGREK